MSNEDIWEKAATYLSHTGETVEDYTNPTSVMQMTFARLYPDAIEATLASMDWGFARKRVQLTDITASSPPSPEWQFTWTLPTDYVMIRGFTIEGRPRGSHPKVQYEVGRSMDDVTARVMFTNIDPFDGSHYMVYTKRVTAFAEWSTGFGIALAAMLAADASMPLGRDTDFQRNMIAYGQRKALLGEYIEFNEEQHNPPVSSIQSVRS